MTRAFADLGRDLRLGLRGWRRTPAVAAAAIAALALGTGATAAMFSVLSGILLRPLPFPDPDQLVQLAVSSPGDPGLPETYVTFADLDRWRARAGTLAGASTYSTSSANLTGVGVPERVATVRADGAFFTTLGAPAVHGRTFRPDDPPNVVVASHGFWQRHFAADAAAVGRTLMLDGDTYTLLGVMPAGFEFPYRQASTDLWTPWVPRPVPNGRLDAVVGRLAPNSTLTAAQAELTALSASLVPGRVARVSSVADAVARPVRQSLLVLMGAVGLLLLVACANVANLLLARAAAARREIAVRVALGAGRWPLLRRSLTDGLLLAGAGGLAGWLVGRVATKVLLRLAASQLPRLSDIQFDWRVFVFLLAVTALTGLAAGLTAALGTFGRHAHHDLHGGPRVSPHHGRMQQGLVIAEIALAFVLLTGAGLLLRTFLNLQGTATGLQPAGVLTLHVAVSGADESLALVSAVEHVPGVTAAGFTSLLPLQDSGWSGRFSIAGRPGEGSAEFRYVTPGYFRAMGIPLRGGRGLSSADRAETEKVVLVNEAFATRYLPGEPAVGRILTDRGRIVGIVGDVRQTRLDRPADPEIYYPVAQNFAQLRSVGSALVVRSDRPPAPLLDDIRRAIRDVRPGQALFRIETMERVIDQSVGRQRLYLWLLGTFAAIGLILAATGVYGIISYLVTVRTREYGIRLALGAAPGRVIRRVLGTGGLLAAVGLAIGLAGAAALTRVLQAQLYGVTAVDPLTLAAGALLLSLVALSACLVPAWRAARVDPVIVLRPE